MFSSNLYYVSTILIGNRRCSKIYQFIHSRSDAILWHHLYLTKAMQTDSRVYLILVYYLMMSSDRIRCRNQAIHQFVCNDSLDISIVDAMIDTDDVDDMWLVHLMVMNTHSTRNKWNRPIGSIVMWSNSRESISKLRQFRK